MLVSTITLILRILTRPALQIAISKQALLAQFNSKHEKIQKTLCEAFQFLV
jgi:hypothetical protein